MPGLGGNEADPARRCAVRHTGSAVCAFQYDDPILDHTGQQRTLRSGRVLSARCKGQRSGRQPGGLCLHGLFNDRYLSMDNYEGVEYWQCENDPSSISVTPAIPDETTGLQVAGSAVALDYVVGLLFDEDACMTDFQLDRADSTPLEARKLYRNLWLHIAKNGINDFTEKAVLFIMADPAT